MSQSDPETTDPAPASSAPSAPSANAPATTARLAQPTRAASRRAQQTAVGVFHLDTGGCGACAQSVYALLAPRYAGALRAEGISMARSPRHADIALITGGMSRAARAAALRTLDATPYPHALVAVGDCAIDGCVFRDSPHLVKDPAETLDANVEIAGCPPAPEAILAAIIEAKRLLSGGADDAESDGETAATATKSESEPMATAVAGVSDGASTPAVSSVHNVEANDEADGIDDDDDIDDDDEYDDDADDTTADEPTEDETKGGRV